MQDQEPGITPTRSDCWDHIWSTAQINGDLDDLSRSIVAVLDALKSSWKDVLVLEAGSGTGRISLELCRLGAKVNLLDMSSEALRLAARLADNTDSSLIRGNLLQLPFADETFDIAWNGGVLEHLRPLELDQAISEMARVTKRSGHVVSFNPNRESLAYRLGKRLQERRGVWPYGFEEPVRSLATEFQRHGITLVNEFDLGTAWAFSFVPEFPHRFLRPLVRIEPLLRAMGAKGYLLASIGRKQ